MKTYNEQSVPRGSDQDCVIEVFNSSGVPINLTAYDNVIVILYHKNKTILQKFSVVSEAGWKNMTIGGASNNELSFRVLSEDTEEAREGQYFYEVRTLAPDAGSTDDSLYDAIVNDQYLFTITPSLSAGLTIP